MITNSQNVRDGVNSDNAKPMDAISSWIRNSRRSRQIVVAFPPAIEFVVPIDREFELQFHPAPQLTLAEAEELLVLA